VTANTLYKDAPQSVLGSADAGKYNRKTISVLCLSVLLPELKLMIDNGDDIKPRRSGPRRESRCGAGVPSLCEEQSSAGRRVQGRCPAEGTRAGPVAVDQATVHCRLAVQRWRCCAGRVTTAPWWTSPGATSTTTSTTPTTRRTPRRRRPEAGPTSHHHRPSSTATFCTAAPGDRRPSRAAGRSSGRRRRWLRRTTRWRRVTTAERRSSRRQPAQADCRQTTMIL